MKNYYYIVRGNMREIVYLGWRQSNEPGFDFWQYLKSVAKKYPANYIIEPISSNTTAYDLAEYNFENCEVSGATKCIDAIASIIDQWREYVMETKVAKIETIKDLIEFLKQFPVDSKISVSYTNYADETDSSAYEDYKEIGGAKYYEYDNSVVLW